MTARVLEMVSLFLKKSMEEGFDPDARRDLVDSLVEDGHNPYEVDAALSIVEQIQQRLESPSTVLSTPRTNRLFIALEEHLIPPAMRGYLTHLVEVGVIDHAQREAMVERLMTMDPEDLEIEDVEWVLDELLDGEPKFLGQFDETISEYYH